MFLPVVVILSSIFPYCLASIDLTGAAVLVTGAAGFIGSHLVTNIIKDGCRSVMAVDIYDAGYDIYSKHVRADLVTNTTGIKIHRGDVCAEDLWVKLFGPKAAFKFTHIVHLAAPRETAPLQCFAFILEQIRNRSKGSYPHVVYVANENSAPQTSRDGEANVDAPQSEEHIAQSFYRQSGLTATGFRLSRVYGPRDRPDRDIARITDSIVAGKTVEVATDKNYLTDYIYIGDVVERITAAIAIGPGSNNVVYDLRSNKLIPTEKVVSLLEKYLSRKSLVRYGSSKANPPAKTALTTQAGFTGKTLFADGLKQYVDWYRKHERSITPCLAECSHSDMCFDDGWTPHAAKSRKLTAGCKYVVYTVGTYTRTWSLHTGKLEYTSCNIAFVNEESVLVQQLLNESQGSKNELTFKNWIVIPVGDFGPNYRDQRKPTRLPKLNPKKFFDPGVLFAVYGDYTINLLAPVEKVVNAMAIHNITGETAAFGAIHHPLIGTDSVRDEVRSITAAYKRGRKTVTYYIDRLVDQSIAYEKYLKKYPGLKFNNVFDGGFLVHNLQSDVGAAFRCRWYREYQQWSDRDQLSGSYAIGMMNYEFSKAAGGEYGEWVALGKNECGSPVYAHLPPTSEHCDHRSVKNNYFYQRRYWSKPNPKPKPKPKPQVKIGNITLS